MTDQQLLKEAGWADNGDGTWTNTRGFEFEPPPTVVPAGVTRTTEEAARLERHRTGGQDIPKGQQEAAAGFAKSLEGKK